MITYAFVGLVVGVIMACVSMVAGSLTGITDAGLGAKVLGLGFGFGAILIAPITYGIVGGIGAALGAVIYNLAARWVGGLEVDIS